MKLKIVCYSTIALLIFSGCSLDDLKDKENNNAPTVDAGKDRVVVVNREITMIAKAKDSDGEIVSYEWKKGSDVLGNNLKLNYLPTHIGVDTLTFTAMDDDGKSSSDSVKITVREKERTTPVEEDNSSDSQEEDFVIKNEFS